ncbi:MAG TPA: gliding motility-associated C-terminal domain-containing protein, partial [Ohtaekwangia sp.]
CFTSATVTVTITGKPVVSATTLKTICSGTATNITFTATPAATYTWTIPSPNGNITGASAGSGSGINQTLSNSSSTQQSVTYSVVPRANGCDGNTFTQTVAIDPKPTVFSVTGGGVYCAGNTGVKVGLSGSQSGVTYSLLLAGTPTGQTSSPGSGAFDFAPVTAIGTYTISASTGASCSQIMNGSVQVTMTSIPTGGSVTSSPSDQLCIGDEFTLTVNGVTNTPSDFAWTLPAGITEISKSGNTIQLKASTGTGGEILVIPSNTCGNGGTLQTSVTVSPLPVVDIVLPSSNVYVDEATQFSFDPIDAGTPVWVFGDGQTSSDPQPVITFTTAGDVSVNLTVTNDAGCSGTDKDNVKVRSSEIGNFAIKNVVTANGDEANGFLYIENITKYPDSEVILIDRWGTEVFRKKGYANDWDLKKGENYLPAGNYVCVVRYDGEVYSRTVTVIKNN